MLLKILSFVQQFELTSLASVYQAFQQDILAFEEIYFPFLRFLHYC